MDLGASGDICCPRSPTRTLTHFHFKSARPVRLDNCGDVFVLRFFGETFRKSRAVGEVAGAEVF